MKDFFKWKKPWFLESALKHFPNKSNKKTCSALVLKPNNHNSQKKSWLIRTMQMDQAHKMDEVRSSEKYTPIIKIMINLTVFQHIITAWLIKLRTILWLHFFKFMNFLIFFILSGIWSYQDFVFDKTKGLIKQQKRPKQCFNIQNTFPVDNSILIFPLEGDINTFLMFNIIIFSLSQCFFFGFIRLERVAVKYL